MRIMYSQNGLAQGLYDRQDTGRSIQHRTRVKRPCGEFARLFFHGSLNQSLADLFTESTGRTDTRPQQSIVMKKLLIAALLAVTTASLQAQFFTLGPKVGVNYTRLVIDESAGGYELQTYGRKPSVVAGGFVQVNLGPINLQPEVLYSQQRSRLAIDWADNQVDAAIRINKLDVPLLAGFNLGRVLRLQAGPVLTRILSASINEAPLSFELQTPEGKSWGYALGVGLDLGRLALDVRYEGNTKKRQLNLLSDTGSRTIEYGSRNLQATLGIYLIK